MSTFFCGLYLLWVALVLGGAAYAWGLRCEGFGCTGGGIVWGAWVVLCGLAAVLGPIQRSFLKQQPALHKVVGWAWGLQSVLGLGLLTYWFLKVVLRAI